MISFPGEIERILKELNEAGFSAHIAGICARERMKGIQSVDWDILTDATVDEVSRIFEKGKKYQTMVRIQDDDVSDDEGYIIDIRSLDGTDIEEYLAGQVFTCNAIGMDRFNTLADPFGGRTDLKSGIVDVIEEPDVLLKKRPEFIFEAVRTAAEIGGDIDEELKQFIKDNGEAAARVPKEKVRDELIGIMNAEDAGRGLSLLYELDLLRYIVGEKNAKLGKKEIKQYEYLCRAINSLEYIIERRLCIFYMFFNERKILPYIKAFKYDSYTMQCLEDMIYQFPVVHFMQKKADLKKLLNEIGMERYEFLFRLEASKIHIWGGKNAGILKKQQLLGSIINNEEIVYEKDLPVERDEFLKAGLVSAEYMDNFINALLIEIYEGKNPKPDHDEVMAMAEKLSKKTRQWKK